MVTAASAANMPDFEQRPSIGQHQATQRIAERLEDLAVELRSMSDHGSGTAPSTGSLINLAQKIYSARREIDKIFGMSGFAVSPAWDIMLDLYQARMAEKQISITLACVGGACPSTTGLRWLQTLENLQLIVRKADPDDRRRHVVELTDGGKVKVEVALAAHF